MRPEDQQPDPALTAIQKVGAVIIRERKVMPAMRRGAGLSP
jgi:hypothetical protein